MARSRLSQAAPIVLVFMLSLVAAHGTAQAADGIPNAFDDVIVLVKEIATAVVRLLIAVGAGLFILGVVRGAFDGLLGTTLGNVFTSTDGVYRAIGALTAFAILLAGVAFSSNFVEFVADRFLNANSMSLPVVDVPSGTHAPPPATVEEALQLDPVQEVISTFVLALIRVMIGVGGALFVVAVASGAFDAQLGNVIGSSMSTSRGYSRILAAGAAILFLILSFPLSKELVGALVPKLLAGGIHIPDILP